jgi:hypothetical protein
MNLNYWGSRLMSRTMHGTLVTDGRRHGGMLQEGTPSG